MNNVASRGELESLQRLGRALHISPNRSAIVKVETVPKIGEKVVDENLKTVGKVFDVFGPVSSPYVAVRPTIQEPGKLINKVLYVFPSKTRMGKVR